MKTLAYLLYGNRREYQLELTLSIASLLRHLQKQPSKVQIVLICDRESVRSDLPIECRIIEPSQFANWTRRGSYNHAAKVGALTMMLENSDGPVALIDTDTIFMKHPDELFERVKPGCSVMQADDRPIGELDFWSSLLNTCPPDLLDFEINPNSPMKNSGVIGVDQADAYAIKEASDLMFAMHDIEPVFNIEQFAVTCALAKNTILTVVPDLVHHYWPVHERLFMHAMIDEMCPQFTEENLSRLVETPIKIGLPPKRVIDKINAAVRSRLFGWDGDYRFAFIAYRTALATENPTHANIWREIARLQLARGTHDSRRLKRDFPGLTINL
ncbi:hypothetical protein [uncultured Sphingomonas sp.]|uniref:hypothetical protein n=1 Tax=uncultured Sphingomonas sp. TaxID=158754 RepID=UPI0035C94BCF